MFKLKRSCDQQAVPLLHIFVVITLRKKKATRQKSDTDTEGASGDDWVDLAQEATEDLKESGLLLHYGLST